LRSCPCLPLPRVALILAKVRVSLFSQSSEPHTYFLEGALPPDIFLCGLARLVLFLLNAYISSLHFAARLVLFLLKAYISSLHFAHIARLLCLCVTTTSCLNISAIHTNFHFHRTMSVGTVLPIMAAGYSGLGSSYGSGAYPAGYGAGYSNMGFYPSSATPYPSTGYYDSGNISANPTLLTLLIIALLILRTDPADPADPPCPAADSANPACSTC
jgi:hypothetical protein